MENKEQNHGLIISDIVESEHYILGDGCLPKDVLMPNGHGWGDFLPKFERQSNDKLETMNCSNYGTLHAIVTLGKKKFGAQFQTDLSERYTGVMTGTTQYGNDPHKVIEIIRNTSGLIPEVYLPFDAKIMTWDQYYSPRPMSPSYISVGISWLKKYKLGHEWVFVKQDTLKTKQSSIKEALKYSPIGIAVYAWSLHSDGLYYQDGTPNHWVELYDYVDGQYWLVFDTYDASTKKVAWDTDFVLAKRYSLDLNVTGEVAGVPTSGNWLSNIAQSISNFIKDLITKNQ